MGQAYLAHPAENVFYGAATFYSATEVEELLCAGRFVIGAWAQTPSRPLAEADEIEPLRAGHGECAFVVAAASRID